MERMEKLIKMLNEYVEKHNKSGLDYTFELENDGSLFCYDDTTDHKGWTMQDEAMVICSKKFGFIKWLYYNNKLDYIDLVVKHEGENYDGSDTEYYDGDESLLMLLSIQDKPIDFLISYLK